MGYTKSEIEKIGNTLIYLQEKIGERISKTKAIKLLYFLEEFSEHIKHSHVNGIDGCFIEPKHSFVDDEFSDSDIQLMDILVENIGHLNATQLIDKTHLPHTLWYKIAKENNLLESFGNKSKTTSDFKIDLSDLLSEDKQEMYKIYLESKEISRSYAM